MQRRGPPPSRSPAANAPASASAEPCTSALISTGSSFALPSAGPYHLFQRAAAAGDAGQLGCPSRRARKSAISRARASLSTTWNSSPACGVPSRPRISTGRRGPALRPRWPRVVQHRPHAAPYGAGDDDVARPSACRVWTSTVATGPRPRSSLALDHDASAARSGLAFRSSTSACSRIASSSLSRPIFLVADTSTTGRRRPAPRPRSRAAAARCCTRLGIGTRLVDLVDGHDHRHARPPWRGRSPRWSAA